MAVFHREVFHELPNHGDGVYRSRGTEGSIERDEYLPSHSSDITEDGGSTPTVRYCVGCRVFSYLQETTR